VSRYGPTLNPFLNNVDFVAAGDYHSLVITSGQVYSFGYNAVSLRDSLNYRVDNLG
jgi:alpha-tubulin suppressor-like RCC1 family protein